MLAYFAASTTNIAKYKSNYKLIIDSLYRHGCDVGENWFIDELHKNRKYTNPEAIVKRDLDLLTHSDIVIAEISVPSFAVGVAVSQALNQRTPVLALYPKSMNPKDISGVFLGYYVNHLMLEKYDKNNIDQTVREFLDRSNNRNLSKFNFLISQEISEYLDWASSKTKRSKSDFLREEIIRKIIDQDTEYKKK